MSSANTTRPSVSTNVTSASTVCALPRTALLVCGLVLVCAVRGAAQVSTPAQKPVGAKTPAATQKEQPASPIVTPAKPVNAVEPDSIPTPVLPKEGVVLDSVVAIVNDDLVLESDIDEELRFAAFQPGASSTRELAIQRLIDRALIHEQMVVQPPRPVTDQELQVEIAGLRKHIAACARYHCETAAGWQRFLADHGFTEKELDARWRERMEVLRFIETRFRSGLRIPQTEVAHYYQQTMLPEYAREHVTPPTQESVAPRIEEVLLQQKVTVMLDEWLKTLRAQGTVRMVRRQEDGQ